MEKKYRKLLFEMADSISLNEETAQEYLKNQNVDLSQYLNKGLNEIRKREFLKAAEDNLERHQILLQNALKKIQTAVPEVILNIENAIKIKRPAFQFRNLKDLDDNQLLEILNDIELITTIEELENT